MPLGWPSPKSSPPFSPGEASLFRPFETWPESGRKIRMYAKHKALSFMCKANNSQGIGVKSSACLQLAAGGRTAPGAAWQTLGEETGELRRRSLGSSPEQQAGLAALGRTPCLPYHYPRPGGALPLPLLLLMMMLLQVAEKEENEGGGEQTRFRAARILSQFIYKHVELQPLPFCLYRIRPADGIPSSSSSPSFAIRVGALRTL